MNAIMDGRMAETGSKDADIQSQIRHLCLHEVYGYLYRRLGSIEDAEDLTAEVYGAALRTPKKPVSHLRAWVFGIARRKLADLRRKPSAPQLSLEDAEDRVCDRSTPETALQQQENVNQILKLVRRLPEDQREALMLQYAEELRIDEIAEVMSKSAAAVNSLLQRARASIFNQGRVYFLGLSEAGNE